MKRKLNVLDLFCGCGGLSLGFENAGYNILMGIDLWEDALITFQRNHMDSAIMHGDLSEFTGEDIQKKLGCNRDDIDVIIGGPPCQGFSLSGKRDLDDPRNKLYKAFVRTVEYFKPKIFLMENVPGLIRLFDGKAKDEILKDFDHIGYNVTYEILLASDFGVPQDRKRVFFVGLNRSYFEFPNDIFEFPEPTHGPGRKYPYLTSKDAIGDLPLLNDNLPGEEGVPYSIAPENSYQQLLRKNRELIFNHTATVHKPKTREIIAMVPDGGNYKNLPQELWETRKVNIAWTRMNSAKPCFTIDTGHNHHFHYLADRVPTVRESARIQSFPDDFIFYGNRTSQLKQVGNAVPPLLAQALAVKIMEMLRMGETTSNELHSSGTI
jgi:DNA (cytosine-5)-methyltransferase 1